MELLKEVAEKIRIKYKDTTIITMFDDFIMLQHLVIRNGVKEIYKTIYIKELEGKLEITVYPERMERIIEVSELDNIIITIQKQSNPVKHTEKEVQEIKEKYVAGTTIELVKMYDLLAPVETGTKGIIEKVDEQGTLYVKWENDRTLHLIVGIDEFKVLE